MPELVGVDSSGFFSYATGEPVMLAFDDQRNEYYNALTGETAELYGDAIRAASETLIGIFGRQGYPPAARYPQQPANYPRRQPPFQAGRELQFPNQSASPGSFNDQGIQLKWYTLLAIGAGLALIATGKRLR